MNFLKISKKKRVRKTAPRGVNLWFIGLFKLAGLTARAPLCGAIPSPGEKVGGFAANLPNKLKFETR